MLSDSSRSSSSDTLYQPGLLEEPGRAAHYLEMSLNAFAQRASIVTAIKAAIRPMEGVWIAVCFGAEAWDRLNPEWRPAKLVPFTALTGANGYAMPATQSDVYFWIHGEDQGDVMDAVLQVHDAMRDISRCVLDIGGFKNREARDLTGFVDGTANPKGDKRLDAALIPEGEAGAGGSYVLTQQWQHHLQAFHQLSVHEQQQVIGRTKQDNIELEGDDMPATSHVSRTDVKVNGVGQKIYRRSTPYGGADNHGLYFLAFACDLDRIRIQLERMLGNSGDGLSDHLMKYSTPRTGAYWFMPSQTDLNHLLNR
ncbi:Dyp-type peroxidase [Thalassolituus sp. LLYu03]|uniref:Dyp-type peroxidase n=1 Tax=Thalassolituus sp. LLYu03 TaxID=3421656 RepID=UPI003D29D840